MARTAYLGSKSAVATTAVDTEGFGVVHFVGVATGSTPALAITDGDTSTAADTVASGALINADGTACDFSTLAKDDVVDFFYIGNKRYVKATVTTVTILAVLEEPRASL